LKSVLSDKQFIFIIGAPRSGTTWLQAMIGAHPLVATTVELTLFSRYISPWIKAWESESGNIENRRWYRGLPFLWSEGEFAAFLAEFLGKAYAKVADTNPGATHILDKNPTYALHVETINRLLPAARFVHVLRDGRDVAVSMVAARINVGFGPETIRDAARMWKEHVRAARKAGQFGNRYMELRYEDLLVEGSDLLKGIFEFCSLPCSGEEAVVIFDAHRFERMKATGITGAKGVKAPKGAYRKGKSGTWENELRPLEKYQFDRIGGDLLRGLGYAEEGWWAETKKEKMVLPLFAAILRRNKVIRRAVLDVLPQRLAAGIRKAEAGSGD
jgi:hypothetical protein